MTSPDRSGYDRAIRDVVDVLRAEQARVKTPYVSKVIDFIEREHAAGRFGSSPETCPTCGGTGPDTVTSDFDSGMLEAACGDEWHDGQPPPETPEGECGAVLRDTDRRCQRPTGHDGVHAHGDRSGVIRWLPSTGAVPEKYRGLAGRLGGGERKLKPWPDEERAAELKERADRFLAETPEGADEQRCELCGGPVRAVTGGEGTSYYVPLGADRALRDENEKLNAVIVALRELLEDAVEGTPAWRLRASEALSADWSDMARAAIEAQREEK